MGQAKLQVFEQFAELARVLGHAHRLELIELVSQGERSVDRLAEVTGLSIANTSQHLQQLRRGGFVQSRRDGKRVLYRLADGPILSLIAALRSYAERNRAEIGKIVADYFQRLDQLEPVSRKELAQRLKAKSAIVLDVRPEDEFALGHVPGALNIPINELKRRLVELPKGQEIVAYCRGPYCVFSFEAVALLRKRGFLVRRLEDGFPEWKAAGLATESASAA
jgi:rhodanese-related sulfurtransferase/DNA-binding transcriptional ArsR family regulator